MRRVIVGLVIASLFIATAVRLAAQAYEEYLDVRIIQVPVVVWRGAEAVTGLTKDDFEVFVNGVRHPITHFDILEFSEATTEREPQATASAGTITPRRPLQERRLTLLLFDLPNSPQIQILRAQPAIEKLVLESSPDDYFAVGLYDGSSVRYLAPPSPGTARS